MMIGHLAAEFFGGAMLANAIPHLCAGTMGRPFHSPFADPPGRGLSSPVVNVLWGFFNVVVGCLLAWGVGDVRLAEPLDAGVFALGALLLALYLARRFGGQATPEAE